MIRGLKNACELLNLRALKISRLSKNCIYQCMGKIFCVKFQRFPLKFHTKYLNQTSKVVDFFASAIWFITWFTEIMWKMSYAWYCAHKTYVLCNENATQAKLLIPIKVSILSETVVAFAAILYKSFTDTNRKQMPIYCAYNTDLISLSWETRCVMCSDSVLAIEQRLSEDRLVSGGRISRWW